MIKRKGLAQIPLMIGLLIMAIAVPVATKLVQESQDTRNRAASVITTTPVPGACNSGNVGKCGTAGGCTNGKKCTYNAGGMGVPSSYSCVTSSSCAAPTATSVPGACNSGNVGKCGTAGGCTNGKKCTYNAGGMGVPSSYSCVTSSSCAAPTPIFCKYGKCESGDEGMTKCVNNAQYLCDGDCYVWVKNCPNGCSGNFCKTTPTSTPIKKPPTNTPTPTGPLKCYCQGNCGDSDNCNWQSAAGGGYIRYCPGYCSGVPTPRQPTNTPTPTLKCGGGNTLGKCGAAGGCELGKKCQTHDLGYSYACEHDSECKQLPSPPTATPTKPTGTNPTSGPIIPSTKPPVGDKCPEAEACPNPQQPNLLQNCTPPDSDGTPNDSLCTKVGTIEPCGGKNYCCPSAGGAWTTDMTVCSAICKVKIGPYTLNDFSIWRSEFIDGAYGTETRSTWSSDFDCDGKVTLNDFSIWRINFINGLLNN